jgi:TonB family protein
VPWFIFFCLDLMHRVAIAVLLICCTSAFAQKWTREKNAPPQPATEAYFSRVSAIILKTLGPELAKHPERLGGGLKVSLFINRQGHIQSPKIVSSTSNRWVQDTALRVVRMVNLPQMPKQVIVEQGQEPVHFEVQWTFK